MAIRSKKLLAASSAILLVFIVGFIMYNNTQQGFLDDYALKLETDTTKYQLAGIDDMPYVNNPQGRGCISADGYFSTLGYNKTFAVETTKTISTDKSQFKISISNVRKVGTCGTVLYDYQIYKDNNVIATITAESIYTQEPATTNICGDISRIYKRSFMSYSDSGKIYVAQKLPANESGIEVQFAANEAWGGGGSCGTGNQAYIINQIDIKNVESIIASVPIETPVEEVIVINDTQIISIDETDAETIITYITNPNAPIEQQIISTASIDKTNPNVSYVIQSTQKQSTLIIWILISIIAVILITAYLMLRKRK